jgi:L-lactate dehydrogenase complex protein LldG
VTQTRERILEAVRAGLGARPLQPQEIAAEAAALLTEPDLIRPQLGQRDLVEVFAEHFISQKLGGTLETILDLESLPDAVRRYLSAQGVPPAIALVCGAK